jgi:hypothetical protein
MDAFSVPLRRTKKMSKASANVSVRQISSAIPLPEVFLAVWESAGAAVMSAAKPAATRPKTPLFLIDAPQQGENPI